MKIYMIAIGKRMPDWVKEAYETYMKRLPQDIVFELKALEPVKRHKKEPAQQIIQEEGRALISAIPPKSIVVALDEHGEQWDTMALANQLKTWRDESQAVSLLIGGPDGLSQDCRSLASRSWSLSRLTFPHPMVRVIVAEQIYRAWTILTRHPYHRD